MARDDYWNSGGRREGIQSSSALDNLERILGIGQGIASNIQAGRDRRSETFKVRMASILGAGENQPALHKRTFNNSLINEMKERFIGEVGTGINRANLETRELYNQYIKEMDREMESNSSYQVQRDFFSGAETKFMDHIQDYMAKQGNEDFNHKEEMQIITDNINRYAEKKANLLQQFGNKLKYDEAITNDISSFLFTSRKFLSSLKGGKVGDEAYIPDPLFNMLVTGLSSDDPQIALSATREYDANRSMIHQSNVSAAEQDVIKGEDATQSLLMEYGQFNASGQEGEWDRWAEYNLELGELHESYNKFYQSTSTRHVNDPLHKGNLDEYVENLRNNFYNDEGIMEKFEKLETEDGLNNLFNEYILKFQASDGQEAFKDKGEIFEARIPNRSLKKVFEKFKKLIVGKVLQSQ